MSPARPPRRPGRAGASPRPPRELDTVAHYRQVWSGRAWWAAVAVVCVLIVMLGVIYIQRGADAALEFLRLMLGPALVVVAGSLVAVVGLFAKMVPHLGLLMRMVGQLHGLVQQQARGAPHQDDVAELAGELGDVREALGGLLVSHRRMVRLMAAEQRTEASAPNSQPAEQAPQAPAPADPVAAAPEADEDPPGAAGGADPLTAAVWPPPPQDWATTSGSLRAVPAPELRPGPDGGAVSGADRGEYGADTGDVDVVPARSPADWWGPAGPPSRSTLDRLVSPGEAPPW